MDTIYIGVDFHARQQTICYLKTETGELVTAELKHQDKEVVRAFYAQFLGRVIVGLEASGYSPWFERMLEELGCEVWLGHASEIRRRARWRQKNDRRDAELILDLMSFPVSIGRQGRVARCCACCVTGRSWSRCAP
jgi:transposase